MGQPTDKPGSPQAAGGPPAPEITANRWQKIKELFGETLERDAAERKAFLDQSCDGDLSLRREVESLLSFVDVGSGFLQPPTSVRLTFPKGTRLGDYEVISFLGPGGMGGAYRARDLRLHRDVAIKVLPAVLSADPSCLHRFEREAQAAASLNHPHIVTIHSIEETGGVHVIVMELVEGQTLDRMIPEDGMSLEKFVQFAADLTDAVAAAHDKRIIHRDLKPRNIMVDNRGSIKILDFGIAKMTELAAPYSSDLQFSTYSETEPGMVMGTVPYISPEQLEGKKLDFRTDIFSLGAVLYEMATGKRPFSGDTRAELISSILRDQPKSVIELRADLPRSLQRVLERCLAKVVTERYASTELRHASAAAARVRLLPTLYLSPEHCRDVGSGVAILESERRSGERVFHRWHNGRDHQRLSADQEASRCRPNFFIFLQGKTCGFAHYRRAPQCPRGVGG